MKHKHTSNIDNIDLAQKLGDLYYDSLSDFLKELSNKLRLDSKADNDRGRVRLANNLINASDLLLDASKEIDLAWEICKGPVNKELREEK